MPNPYKSRTDVRRFLNLAGFYGGAYIVAYVEDTSDREIAKRNHYGNETGGYFNPEPRIILEIADCSNRINLEFEVNSRLQVANSLNKIDTLVEALVEFRAALLEERKLFRARATEVERLNLSVDPTAVKGAPARR